MRKYLVDSISGLKPLPFSRLAIRHLRIPANWPVSIVHENIPKNGNVPYVVHRKTAEFVYILSGNAKAFLGSGRFNVRGGDYLLIPPGVRHRFVTGNTPMTALSVFSPPMTFDNPDATACPAPGKRRNKKT